MIITNTFLGGINLMSQLKWIRPALMTLALLANVLVVTGCTPHH